MTMIEAVSQSTGVERKVEVTAAPEGVRVTIRDGRKGTVLTYVTAPTDELMTVLSDQPEGPTAITGDTAGAARVLAVEVRRNEVWLAVGGVDAAVGLDDLMDALAALPSRAAEITHPTAGGNALR
jgi:hypothetical protein